MQETTDWQDAAALERFQMISPLLDPEMDNAKRIQLRSEIASSRGLSPRTITGTRKATVRMRSPGSVPLTARRAARHACRRTGTRSSARLSS